MTAAPPPPPAGTPRRGAVAVVLAAVRWHQWAKNVLVLVPLVAAHRVGETALVLRTLLAFVAFCLCASAGYLVNDVVDLPHDRAHARKRGRPLAAGEMTRGGALGLAAVLAALSAAAALALPWRFGLALLAYFLLALSYSLVLKRLALVDVVVLAVLYTLRIVAGGAAGPLDVSFWLLALSLFLFFSLALVKRYTELLGLGGHEGAEPRGRGYRAGDLGLLQALGASSGCLAVLVVAFYVNSPRSAAFYARPQVIWLLCPLLLYWVSRVWLKAARGEVRDDPVVFAIGDGPSWAVVALGLVIMVVALVP